MSSQFGSTIDTYVCSDCFGDYAIKTFIDDNAVETRCTYCGRTPDSPISAHFSEVFKFILEGIETEWEDPAESMAYESSEGGYQGAPVYDWYDLITEIIEELFEINADVLDDILSVMAGEHAWCHKDPYGLLEEEALSISWKNFSRQVKYQTRYIFSHLPDAVDRTNIDLIPIPRMLNILSRELSRLEDEADVVLTIEQDKEIMRARIHDMWKRYVNGHQLGTVPAKEARFSNRMSPSGIPMFYGAFDSDTALLEVIYHKRFTPPWKVATIATFKTTKALKLLDLSNLPQVPSLFDQRMNYLRSTITFLHEFARELSKPIKKDGTEHIEYVPTQVFTEYIRHLFRDRDGNSLDGIKYVSAKANQQSCCVLFVNNEQCCGTISNPSVDNVANPECILLLQKIERKRVLKIRGVKIPKGLLTVAALLLASFAALFILLVLPTYLPKLGEALTGGMPQPEGLAISFQEDSAPYRVGLPVEVGVVDVSITDAFVCRSYDYIPPCPFTDVITIYAEENAEFVFVGMFASCPSGQESVLPQVTDISLICGDNELKGTLPTSFEPFSVPELRERARWFFFSFGSVPYHDEETDSDNIVCKRMGYIVFSKPREYIDNDCIVMVLVQGDILTRVLWSLSGIERGAHSK